MAANATEPVAFDREGAARYVGLSVDQIDQARAAGLLTACFPTGSKRTVRFRRKDLDRWVAAWDTHPRQPVAT